MDNIFSKIFITSIFICFFSISVIAEEKKEVTALEAFVIKLKLLLEQHNDIRASDFDKQSLESNLEAIKKSRFPTLSIVT